MKFVPIMLIAFVAAVLFSARLVSPDGVSAAGNGAEIFKNSCARCHGADGKGGDGPDLTDPQRKAKWQDSDERIVNKVTNGGRRMPAFADKLSAEEIKSVAAHVRSL